MTTLPGYSVPEDMLLGWIAWYTVSDPKVTHADLTAQINDLGLDPSIIPAPPRAGDAFKRACRYSEMPKVPVPMSDNYVNFLIRKVNDQPDELLRQLVLEVVDPAGKTIEFLQPARMRLDRTTNKVELAKKRVGDPYDDMAADALALFQENWRDALVHLDPQTLRRMVRRQLDVMSAIAVRRQGSVYFIPASQAEKTEGLEELLSTWNNNSMFHIVPLVDTENQRNMVKSAFEEEIHAEATEMIGRLASKIKSGETLSPTGFAEYKGRFDELVERAKEYGKLVRVEASKANDELSALQDQLGIFMNGGNVIQKRKPRQKAADEQT